MLANILDDLFSIGSYMYISIDNLALEWFKGHFNLKTFYHKLVSVDQGLVHIENYCFPT